MAKVTLDAATIADVDKVWTGKELFDVGNADLQAISTARKVTFTTSADKRALVKGIIDDQVARGVEQADGEEQEIEDAGDTDADVAADETVIQELHDRIDALEEKLETLVHGFEHGVKSLVHKVDTLWEKDVKSATASDAVAGVTPMANVQKTSGPAVAGAPVVQLDADGKPVQPNTNLSSNKSEATLTKESQAKTAAITGVAIDANTGQAVTDATDKEAIVDGSGTDNALTPAVPAAKLQDNVVVPPVVTEGATTNPDNAAK